MYSAEFDAFKQTLTDLCVSVNRPVNDDLVRVFWEDLRPHSLTQIQDHAKRLRVAGKTRFTSSDLRPEPKAPSTFEPLPTTLDHFARFANIQLFKFLRVYDAPASKLSALIRRKNEIIDAARHDPEMQPGGDEAAQGTQLHEILFAAWRQVIAQ